MAIATPDQIRFAAAVPKTLSGKIMIRLQRDIAAGRENICDTTTLDDYTVLAKLREEDECFSRTVSGILSRIWTDVILTPASRLRREAPPTQTAL